MPVFLLLRRILDVLPHLRQIVLCGGFRALQFIHTPLKILRSASLNLAIKPLGGVN
jgi:hypothetical protein